MFNLSNNEMRERSLYLEKTQLDLEQGLQVAQLAEVIGHNVVATFNTLNNLLYIPDFSTGIIDLPKSKQDTNAIPYLAMKPSEAYSIAPNVAMLSPLQKRSMMKVYKTFSNDSDKYLDRSIAALSSDLGKRALTEPLTISIKDGEQAIARSHIEDTTPYSLADPAVKYDAMVVTGRPIVGMKYGMPNQPDASHLSLLHELSHAYQLLQAPGLIYAGDVKAVMKRRAEQELQAYRIGSLYASILRVSVDAPHISASELQQHLRIEQIRMKHADPDPEHPCRLNQPLLSALRLAKVDWAQWDY